MTDEAERLYLESRPHGVVLARPFLRAAALALIGAGLLSLGWPASLAGAPVVIVAAGFALLAAYRWERTLIVVTSDRVQVIHGALRRRSAAVRLEAGSAVEVEQPLLGRLLGYGTLLAGDLEVPFVPQPRRAARLVERVG